MAGRHSFSYLTYLRDRLTVARDLLTESGSIFVQIGDENVHRVRAVMDEVFGEENFVDQIVFQNVRPGCWWFLVSTTTFFGIAKKRVAKIRGLLLNLDRRYNWIGLRPSMMEHFEC